MFVRVPVLIDQPNPRVAVARLLDEPNYQAIAATVEQAMRSLKRTVVREIKRLRVSSLHTWASGELRQKTFSIQPALFHKDRRYPAGPRVNLPVRYVELVDPRDEHFVMLPDFGDVLYVPEKKLLKTILAETVRSRTATLKPQEIQRLWPSEESELRWTRLTLASPKRYNAQKFVRILTSVAEPVSRRNLALAGGSRERELGLIRLQIPKGSCLLVGESGVGKSTLIGAVAREIENEKTKASQTTKGSRRATFSAKARTNLLAKQWWKTYCRHALPRSVATKT